MRLAVLLLFAFFQAHLIPQRLQAPHGPVALAHGIQGVEVVRPQILVVLVGAQHLVDDHQQAMADRDQRPHLAQTPHQTMELG